MRRLALAVFATVGLIWATPTIAFACSQPASVPLVEVLEDGETVSGRPVVGVHQQRHIARIPGIPILVNERSASVVTRYWGAAPNLSVASHGDEGVFLLTTTSCGTPARPIGHETVHANDAGDLERPRYSISYTFTETRSGLSDDEADQLTARFGPPVVVSLGPDDYVVAWALLLWRPAVTFGTLGLLGYGAVRRARGVSANRHLDRRVVAAALAGVTLIAVAGPSYGLMDWLGMLVAVAATMFIAWLARAPVIAVAVTYWAYHVIRSDSLFVELDSGDSRLQIAIGGLVLSAGALAVARGHWSRFVITPLLLFHSFFMTIGLTEVRGFRDMAKVVGLAGMVTAAVGVTVWFFVFRKRVPSPGARPQPPGVLADVDRSSV